MAVKALTKDGKVPLSIRLTVDEYEVIKRFAFDQDITPNQAVVKLVRDTLIKDCE